MLLPAPTLCCILTQQSEGQITIATVSYCIDIFKSRSNINSVLHMPFGFTMDVIVNRLAFLTLLVVTTVLASDLYSPSRPEGNTNYDVLEVAKEN